MLFDAYVLKLLRFVTATLCAATFSNSYVFWCKRCVMLRFVAVPIWVLPRSLFFHLTVRNAKGFSQKYITKRTNYQYMAMGHWPPDYSDFPHTLSQCRKTLPLWANAERISPYTEPKKAERFSPYTEPMQKDIPLIRGQCRITFLYAEPKWNDQKLWISIWASLIRMYSILFAPKCRGSWYKSKHKCKCGLVA